MQGYILNVKKAKNEDTIVSILTPEKLKTLYRFYGARHPIVTTGYKIDFEVEQDSLQFMPRLRNVIHLGFQWLKESERLQVWQHFIALLYEHLRDVELPGPFYFGLLEHYAAIWHLQNPKRSAVEAYLSILEHEGRLHDPDLCFACGRPLNDEISLIRSFLPAHPNCVIARSYPRTTIQTLMATQKTILLDDKEVEGLWLTLLEGM
ncbi:recombination protein RecO [Hydrogenimonas cancrithermarum]|uniref:Recombination protein RecO n=1 Tax=Hydrogenimonas cancrithermarum TaxID=2993563 RepID=A0ABN6WTK7_9BACT|nr:recombination protein RecO [Hydrogenimonas cancrithermarum]BDY12326.1 recombination protein RecO [Hydrogenimonas cancrithermarum]